MAAGSDTVALVLAGGEATRMGGGDKPLLTIGGQSMLARILATLASQVARRAISANGDPSRFAAFGVPVLEDGVFLGRGPLAGVLAGLEWAAEGGARALLTVPGDTPFVPADLIGALAPAPACAMSGGRVHPLVALWPVSARIQLRAALTTEGALPATRFADAIGMRRVVFDDRAGDPFFNVNTRADLDLARAGASNTPPDAAATS